MGLAFPEAFGGQDLPWLVNTAVAEIWNAANLSFQLCPLLTQGAIEAILHHGTEEQRQVYGDQAGQRRMDRGHVPDRAAGRLRPRRRADPGGQRRRRLPASSAARSSSPTASTTWPRTSSIWSWPGWTARRPAPGASPCSSCPSSCRRRTVGLGRRNDLRCVSLEHKLGINASPTCVMAYGDDEGAVGFLLGEENAGHALHVHDDEQRAPLRSGIEGLGLGRARLSAGPRLRPRARPGPDRGAGASSTIPMSAACCSRCARRSPRCARSVYWTAGFVDRSVRAADAAERARPPPTASPC